MTTENTLPRSNSLTRPLNVHLLLFLRINWQNFHRFLLVSLRPLNHSGRVLIMCG